MAKINKQNIPHRENSDYAYKYGWGLKNIILS